MKVLYAARYARFDLLRAVCALAQQVTKWTRECDLKLYRLMCYIAGSNHIRMTGWVGDDRKDLALHLFADADFAGCSKTSRSTSGMHLVLLGPNSNWPIQGQSKKQSSVSHSTPEAEIVAADHAVRSYGVPALELWELILADPKMIIQFHEDNNTACIVLRTGYSGAMGHIERNHGVKLRSLAERFKSGSFHLFYERSALMAADIYTKAFNDAPAWQCVMKLVNHLDPALFWAGPAGGGKVHMPSEHKGGVKFSYFTPNPWAAQPDDRGLAATGPASVPGDEWHEAYHHGR